MDFNDVMLERNARFAETEFAPELKMLPSTGTVVIGCVDPRVDPVNVLGLKQGEAAVIRNVGGSRWSFRDDPLYLQFRSGRLTGWKADWSRNWMWQ